MSKTGYMKENLIGRLTKKQMRTALENLGVSGQAKKSRSVLEEKLESFSYGQIKLNLD